MLILAALVFVGDALFIPDWVDPSQWGVNLLAARTLYGIVITNVPLWYFELALFVLLVTSAGINFTVASLALVCAEGDSQDARETEDESDNAASPAAASGSTAADPDADPMDNGRQAIDADDKGDEIAEDGDGKSDVPENPTKEVPVKEDGSIPAADTAVPDDPVLPEASKAPEEPADHDDDEDWEF